LKGEIELKDIREIDVFYEMRREGIDFILDPLWNHVNANLFEHIDGLNSTSPRPSKTKKT